MYYTTQGIEPIFYNNYRQNITFKSYESLYYTSETKYCTTTSQLKNLIKKYNTSLKYFASILYTDAIRNKILQL